MSRWTTFLNDLQGRGLYHALSKALKFNCYMLVGRSIHLTNGPFHRDDVLPLDDIVSWRVEHEMIFDIVRIELRDGSVLTWFDYYDDLLPILWAEAEDRNKE